MSVLSQFTYRSFLVNLSFQELCKCFSRNGNLIRYCLTFSIAILVHKSSKHRIDCLLVGLDEVGNSLDYRFEGIMISVGDLAHSIQEVHVPDLPRLVFIQESNESIHRVFIQRYCFKKHCFQTFGLHSTIIKGISFLQQCEELSFFVWVNLSIDLTEDFVPIIHCFVFLTTQVSQ